MSLNINKSNLNKHYYRTYGLNIESEIEIPEFMSIKNEETKEFTGSLVKMSYGVMEDNIKALIDKGQMIGFTENKLWFHIKDVATYYVANGDTVICEPCENPDKQLINVFLMCSCLGFIMIQRDKVAIHGGTIVIDDKAIIITGDRGAGKSTLTTALRLKGYPFIADDVAGTVLEDVPMINPGFPYQKLCEDAMDRMGYDKESCVSFTGDGKTKYMIPAHEQFIEHDVNLHGIFELTVGDVESVQIEEVKGNEKLSKIIANIYRTEFLTRMGGMKPKYMKQCIDIARHIKFYKITRPKNKFVHL